MLKKIEKIKVGRNSFESLYLITQAMNNLQLQKVFFIYNLCFKLKTKFLSTSYIHVNEGRINCKKKNFNVWFASHRNKATYANQHGV